MSKAVLSQKPIRSRFFGNELLLGLLIFGGFSLVGIATRPLLPVDETRYLTVAWEMWQSGNYLVPTLNGEIYSHKPPLLFWLINFLWSIGGVNEWSARLIGPAAGLISIGLTATLSRTLWPGNIELSRKAALIVATTGIFLVFASLTMFDTLLTVGVLIAIIGLVRFWQLQKLKWLLIFSIGIAFGVLSKGPVVLIHVIPAAFILPFLNSSPWRMRKIAWFSYSILGILFALLLVGLWLVPALISGGPEYQEAVLWTQSAGRITNYFAHQRPAWAYVAFLPLLLWPWAWSPFVWNFDKIKGLMHTEMGLFCCLWSGAVLILFSAISGKQPHYLLPTLPVFSLVLAFLFEEKAPSKVGFLPSMVFPVLLLIILILLLAGYIPVRNSEFFISEMGLISLLFIFGAVLFIGIFFQIKKSRAFTFLAPITLVALHVAAFIPIHDLYDSSKIGKELALYQKAGMAIVGRSYHGEFNFTGRLMQPVDIIYDQDKVDEWVKNHPGGALLGVLGETAPNWESDRNYRFRNRSYAIWVAPKEAL